MRHIIRTYPILSFIVLTIAPNYLLLIGLLGLGIQQDALKGLKAVFAFTPLVWLLVVTVLTYGIDHVPSIFRAFIKKQTRWYHYAVALLLMPCIAVVVMLIRYSIDGFFPAVSEFAPLSQIALMTIPLLFFPGITEEFAWRGFLQRKLQHKFAPVIACLMTGLVWGAWHGFDFLLGNWDASAVSVVAFCIYIAGTAQLVGWCFNISGGSVLIAMLAHFGANVVNFFMPMWNVYEGEEWPIVVFVIACVVIGCVLNLISRRVDVQLVPTTPRTDSNNFFES